MSTAITGVRIFDGVEVVAARSVVIDDGVIVSVGGVAPPDAEVVDGEGATLLPGLIDAHVHTDVAGLRDALAFGVTTELEMQGRWTPRSRRQVAARDDIADLRTSGMGVTRKGGHPAEYVEASGSWLIRHLYRFFPSVRTPEAARRFVAKQVASGADYVKVFIEDGTTIGYPGLPVVAEPVLRAAVGAAHDHGRLAIAHVSTAAGRSSPSTSAWTASLTCSSTPPRRACWTRSPPPGCSSCPRSSRCRRPSASTRPTSPRTPGSAAGSARNGSNRCVAA